MRLNRGDFDDIIPPAGDHPCRGGCGSRVERPGVCEACGREHERREHDATLRMAIESIPGDFRWSSLESIRSPEYSGRVHLKPRALQVADRLLGYRVLVLVGESGAGKTSLGCALLRAIIDAGRFGSDPKAYERARRARFIDVRELFSEPERNDTPHPATLAVCMPVVLLDDVGQEAGRGEGFKADERVRTMADILCARHDAPWAKTIVTTFAREAKWRELYGDGVARRYWQGRRDTKVLDLDAATSRATEHRMRVARAGA